MNVNCEVSAYRPMRLAELAATAWAVLAGDVAAADNRGHGRAVMNTGPKGRRLAVRSFGSFAEYEAWRAEHEPFDTEALAMKPEERLVAAAALTMTPNSSGRRPPSASTRSTTVRHEGAEGRPRWPPSCSHAARGMRVGPSEPPGRGRLQTAVRCFGQEPGW